MTTKEKRQIIVFYASNLCELYYQSIASFFNYSMMSKKSDAIFEDNIFEWIQFDGLFFFTKSSVVQNDRV